MGKVKTEAPMEPIGTTHLPKTWGKQGTQALQGRPTAAVNWRNIQRKPLTKNDLENILYVPVSQLLSFLDEEQKALNLRDWKPVEVNNIIQVIDIFKWKTDGNDRYDTFRSLLSQKIGKKEIKESSTVAAIKGFSAPFGGKVKRKRGYKKNPSRPYGDPELFEASDVEEVVRKRGNAWVYYDDETGVQKGSYKDRESAWQQQRRDRATAAKRKTSRRSERERQEKSLKVTKAKGAETSRGKSQEKRKEKSKKHVPGVSPRGHRAHKGRPRKSEVLMRALVNHFLKENRTMISYMFEQAPASEETLVWDKFMHKVSREAIMSDPKLKGIIQKIMKSEANLLGKAVAVIAGILKETGSFDVQRKGAGKDPLTGEVTVEFLVKMLESGKSLKFAVRLENGRPLLVIPEESRDAINSLATPESKLLRAELMHAQETALANMDDVLSVTSKRDKYLNGVQNKIEAILNKMGPLEISMLRHILRKNYKGVK